MHYKAIRLQRESLTEDKLKIAQVVGNAKTGGVISCVLNFYRNIDRTKFQFDFYTYGESPYDEEIKALGGRVFYIPDALAFFKSVKALKQHFKSENYFAVHAHLTTLSFVPLLAAKKAKIKFRICHAHSTSHKSEGVIWFIKNTLKHLSRLYPTHLAGCSMLSNNWLYGKKHGKDAFLLRNAIDFDRFCFNAEKGKEMREKLGIDGGRVIGHIGRFEFQKNVPFLIEAFSKLTVKDSDTQLALVSGVGELDRVKAAIEKYGLKSRVHLLLPTKTVEDYFNMFDLFALPSRFEGLPLVAVEAQTMGIPCLLSNEITPETNVSGKCEFFPIDSTDAWAEKMSEMLNSAQRYDERRLILESGYEITAEAKRLADFYMALGEKK